MGDFLMKKLPIIRLLVHKKIDDETIRLARKVILETFTGIKKVEHSVLPDISSAFNPLREQYNAERILDTLVLRVPPIFLALIPYDLFVPNLNFVFGVALPLRGCVISTYRLKLYASRDLYQKRLLKTIRHELGHVFGLQHCSQKCVMRFANSLYELDIKPPNFCPHCYKILLNLGVIEG